MINQNCFLDLGIEMELDVPNQERHNIGFVLIVPTCDTKKPCPFV